MALYALTFCVVTCLLGNVGRQGVVGFEVYGVVVKSVLGKILAYDVDFTRFFGIE